MKRKVLIPCGHCGKQLPLSMFYEDKTKQNGKRSWCKLCISENHKKRYAENPAKYREEGRISYLNEKRRLFDTLIRGSQKQENADEQTRND